MHYIVYVSYNIVLYILYLCILQTKTMGKKEVLLELVDQYYEFSNARPDDKDCTMTDFLGYLNAKNKVLPISMRKFEGQEEGWLKENHRKVNNDISILMVFMYRYAKGYIKKALRDSVLQTPEEFTFLITLMTYTSMTKTQLINSQIMEKTSGTEIIKRLFKLGLIDEKDDHDDRRSKQVFITELGRNEIISLLPVIDTVADIVIANLSIEERNSLAYLLNKMDHYHNDIFQNKKNVELQLLVYSGESYVYKSNLNSADR